MCVPRDEGKNSRAMQSTDDCVRVHTDNDTCTRPPATRSKLPASPEGRQAIQPSVHPSSIYHTPPSPPSHTTTATISTVVLVGESVLVDRLGRRAVEDALEQRVAVFHPHLRDAHVWTGQQPGLPPLVSVCAADHDGQVAKGPVLGVLGGLKGAGRRWAEVDHLQPVARQVGEGLELAGVRAAQDPADDHVAATRDVGDVDQGALVDTRPSQPHSGFGGAEEGLEWLHLGRDDGRRAVRCAVGDLLDRVIGRWYMHGVQRLKAIPKTSSRCGVGLDLWRRVVLCRGLRHHAYLSEFLFVFGGAALLGGLRLTGLVIAGRVLLGRG
mmetsp:Transcript_28989/g.83762  ORF Transcript_28989/g.83762 Transcript_28989/m.83762 type:complete len:325 (+) Transcript_28989:787-1761(+)